MNCFDNYPAAVTICDLSGIIIYMNEKSKRTFEKDGVSLIGKSLFDCHQNKSSEMIKDMMAKDYTNCYTIEKNGVKKMIYQAPWKSEGKVAGMIEMSFEIPFDMPHFIRS